MSKPDNVKIPLPLLTQTIDLLENWNLANYDPSVQYDYDRVYHAFLKKRQSLDLREAYARILLADNEDSRQTARMNYLQQKRRLNEDF